MQLFNNGWHDEPSYDLRWLVIGIVTLLMVIFLKEANAYGTGNNWSGGFNDTVTMEVIKADKVGGGTYRCPSVRACYIKVLEAEARGANQYCESLTIKRNGQVVWWRKYQ